MFKNIFVTSIALLIAACSAIQLTSVGLVYATSNTPTPLKTSQEQKADTGKAAKDAKHAQNESGRPSLSVTVDNPITIQKSKQDRDAETSNSKHKASNEWWLIFWTAVLACITLLLAGITGVLARYTYKLWFDTGETSKRQAHEVQSSLRLSEKAANAAKESADVFKANFVASNRPWLYIDAKIKGPIDFMREPIMVPIEYTVTNSGHSPALSVWITAELIVHNLGRAAWDIQRDYCDGMRRTFLENQVGDPKAARVVAFPYRPYIETAYYQIDPEQLRAAINVTGSYAQSLLIGCVNYRTSVDSDAHQTRFIFEFRRPDGIPAVVWSVPKTPADEISLGRYFIGDVAD